MAITKIPQVLIEGQGSAAILDVGTTANKVVQLDGDAKLPAVDASNVTGIGLGKLFQAAERELEATNSVEWTGFSAGNTYIKIVAEGMSAGANGSDPIIQIGDAGGYETGGYLSFMYDVIGNTEDTSQSTHIPLTLAGATSVSSDINRIVVELHKSSELTEKWTAVTTFWQFTTATEYVVGSCSKTLSAEIKRVKLYTDDSTNWSAGTAILYRDVE